MRRWVASGSGSAAALVRRHASTSSPTEALAAWSSSRPSADRSTLAASATARACAGESRPSRAAARVAGRSSIRAPVAIVAAASDEVVPVVRASHSAALRSPDPDHDPARATRAAAAALSACAARSTRST
jgi:hypothetical protein